MEVSPFRLQINENGEIESQEIIAQDEEYGRSILQSLQQDDFGKVTCVSEGKKIIVEAFDSPLLAQQVLEVRPQSLEILFNYGYQTRAPLSSLTLDEWDRFHGLTQEGVHFVFSRKAQAGFFQILEEFDDDSITVDGQKIGIPPYYNENSQTLTADFWSKAYQESESPGWNLKAPSPALVDVWPKLKLQKSRILVLGCGYGHDAAFLAEQGHIVTAIDISPEAIHKAQLLYGKSSRLQFLVEDAFALSPQSHGPFDLIFEHTFFAALAPSRRKDIVKLWKKLLAPQGQILAIFFVMNKRTGPPYGSSEWELREYLKRDFQFLYWFRTKKSVEFRQGTELVILAQKK